MSKGGSGDTLTGIVLALALRNQDVEEATADAVFLHGLCADLWQSKYPAQTMRPFDIHKLIPDAVQKIMKEKK